MALKQIYPGPELKRADIDASASGATTIVSAVAGKKIRVKYVFFTVTSVVAVGWYDSTPTEICKSSYYDQYFGIPQNCLPHEEAYVCETDTNKDLDIYLSGASTVRGFILYQEI